MKAIGRSLASISGEIAFLHDQFARRDADIRFVGRGGKVFYALDNDVTTTITAPWLDEGTHVFGPLFTNLSEAHFAFATVFAEYVFGKGSSDPFLLIPPANNELEGQWNSVMLQAANILESIELHFSNLLDAPTNELAENSLYGETDLFETIERAVQIIYGGKSPATELRRIARLAESGSLRRLDSYLDDDGVPLGSLPELSSPEFVRIESGWMRRLQRRRPKGDSSNTIDASVLATIEIMNRNFIRDEEPKKLCLITGDTHIYEAASEVTLDGGSSFSHEYLRRPTAFLADRDFFQRAGIYQSSDSLSGADLFVAKTLAASVGDWIKEIAAIPLSRSLGHDRQRSTHLVDAIEDARASWSRFLRSAGALHSISPKEISDIAHTHVKAASFLHLSDVRIKFEELRQQAKLAGEESKLRFSVAGALSRFWSIDTTMSAEVDRLPPIVRFDTLKCAERVATEIATQRGDRIRQLQKTKQWLIELRQEDSSQYTTMIIFALSFATLGEWGTALNVAKAAYAIARTRRSMKPTSGVKGDEAAYLCAVFGRLSAQSAKDLEAASSWLDESERLLLEEPVRMDVASGKTHDIRLTSERLSLRLTRQLFLHFAPSSADHQVALALSRKIETFETLYHLNRDQINYLIEPNDSIRGRYTFLQLLINSLQCALLSSHPVDFDEPENNSVRIFAIRELFGLLGEQQEASAVDPKKNMRSVFCDFVLLVAGVALFQRYLTNVQLQSVRRLLDTLPKNGSVLPYDELRRAEFLRLARR